jgi:hypothetical protein
VGPAPGGGLPLRRHCHRPEGVLPLPQQTSSDGDVGGTKQPPPVHTRRVAAAVAPCGRRVCLLPSCSSRTCDCCALVAAVCVPCLATTAQMLWTSAMAWAAAAASACCCGWSGCCLRCSGGVVMLISRPPTRACTSTTARRCCHHSGYGLGPHTRTALSLHPTPAMPPPAHALPASSAACTAVPTTNRSMSRDAPSPWLTQIDSAPLAARARCSTSRSWCLLRGLPRVVCKELRRAAAPAG